MTVHDDGSPPSRWPYQEHIPTWQGDTPADPDPVVKWFNDEFFPAWKRAMDALSRALGEFTDSLLDAVNEVEQARSRAKKKPVQTPPLDHTQAHVTHTSTKPPRPVRHYHRRTP